MTVHGPEIVTQALASNETRLVACNAHIAATDAPAAADNQTGGRFRPHDMILERHTLPAPLTARNRRPWRRPSVPAATAVAAPVAANPLPVLT